MFRTKRDVDKHVSGILARLKDENEKHMRGFNFARLYFGVRDYDSAKRHLAGYLTVNEKHSAAHKLMGQVLEATGHQEQALQAYKRSLTLDENQKDVVLKICDIYCNVPVDPGTATYWLERAEKLFPGDEVIFKLKEGMARVGGEPNTKDLENLITSELLTRPNSVGLRVKLLRLLLNSGRVQEAHKHALQAEEQPDFLLGASRSLDWLRCLADVCAAYQEQEAAVVDHHFLTKYLLTLDQLAELSLSDASASAPPADAGSASYQTTELRTEEAAVAAVRALDRLLDKAHQQRWTRTGAWAFAVQQTSAQLYLHLATLLLKRAFKEGRNWQEASRWASALLLTCYAQRPPESLHQGGWFLQMEQGQQETLRAVFLRALHRMSLAGHIVRALCGEEKSRWLARIKEEVCTAEVRERIFQSVLAEGQGSSASWFLNDTTFLRSSLEFPTLAALEDYDKESQLLYPDSLNHLVWLALHHNAAADNKSQTPESHFEVRVFASLQRETLNQHGGIPESLSQMDTEAFVEATRWCAAQALSQGRRIPGPLCLPPHVGIALCTQPQANWWKAAHQLHTNGAGEQLAEFRRVLQRGLEVIRGIGNHGLDPMLVVHLARTFAERASFQRERCQEEEVCQALDGRAALYWQLALSLLDQGSRPQALASPRGPPRRLFGPPPHSVPLSTAEARALRQEACLFLAVRAMNAGCLDEAAEMLADLPSAEAAFYTALVSGQPAQRMQACIPLSNVQINIFVTSCHRNRNQEGVIRLNQSPDEVGEVPAVVMLRREEYRHVGCAELGRDGPGNAAALRSAAVRFTESTYRSFCANNFHLPAFSDDDNDRSKTASEQIDDKTWSPAQPVRIVTSTASKHDDCVFLFFLILWRDLLAVQEVRRAVERVLPGSVRPSELSSNSSADKIYRFQYRGHGSRYCGQAHLQARQYACARQLRSSVEYSGSRIPGIRFANPTQASSWPPHGHYRKIPKGRPHPIDGPPPFYSATSAPAAATSAPGFAKLVLAFAAPVLAVATSAPEFAKLILASAASVLAAATSAPEFAKLDLAFATSVLVPATSAPGFAKLVLAFATSVFVPATSAPAHPPTSVPAFVTSVLAFAPSATRDISSCPLYRICTTCSPTVPVGGSASARICGSTLYRFPAARISSGEKRASRRVFARATAIVFRNNMRSTSTPRPDRSFFQTRADPDATNFDSEVGLTLLFTWSLTNTRAHETGSVTCFEPAGFVSLFRFLALSFAHWSLEVVPGSGSILHLRCLQYSGVNVVLLCPQVLKVCANHNVHASMTLTPMPKKDTAWIWDAQDFADGEPRPEKFCVRFKTPEIAVRFKDAFEQAVQKSRRPRASSSSSSLSGTTAPPSSSPAAAAVFSPATTLGFGSPKSSFGSTMAASAVSALTFGSPVAATIVASGSPPACLPSLPATGFGKMFHPKPGAWSCHVCYVSNESNKMTCAACDSPKPGTEKPKTPLASATSTQPSEIASSKASSASPVQSVFGEIAGAKASSAPPGSSVFGEIAKSKASSGAIVQSLFGEIAASKMPSTSATAAAPVFTFGVTMPDQKPAAAPSMFGSSSGSKNVLGGFTFSTTPKVKETPKEVSKSTPVTATTKGEAAKPSPFASFSFQSPPKKEEPKEAAASPFVMGARSEISKLSLTPSSTSTAAPSTAPTLSLAKSATSAASVRKAPAKSPLSGSQEVPEEFVPNVEFEPVVPLPDLVEAKTGEEDEEVLFCERAKLYRYDGETKQWKERGVGQLKILRHGDTGACRVLMRRDQVLKLCANHRIMPEMKLGPLATGDRAWSWFAKDYSEGELNSEQLAVRFKTREQAEHFRQVFDRCRDEAAQAPPPVTKAEDAEGKADEPPQQQQEQQTVPLSQLSQFRPKQGVWSCEACYVANAAERTACLACETPRPGSAQPGPGAPSPLSALEKFASPVIGNTGFPVGPSSVTAPAKFTFGFPSAGTATAPTQGSPSSKAPGFVFGCGTQQFGGGTTTSTFTFGAAVSSTDTPSTSTASAQTPGAFKFGSPQKYEFSFSGVRPRSPGKTPKSPGTPTDVEEEDAGSAESPEADIYFQPVIPLPPKVDVKTGEEGEELLYGHRAKLYRWLDGEWKERGLGDIKLLFDPTAGRVRLLMRREPVLKVCLNHLLTRELQLSKKDDKVVLWSATDFSDGEPSPHQFALRLKTPQLADEFLAAVESAKARLGAPSDAMSVTPEAAPQVDASTFSFRLDGDEKEPSSSVTPPTAAGSFSLASRFGGSRQTVVRSLFGNASPVKSDANNDVEVVFVAKATDAQVARARELQLPDNFFLYETKPPCPGCRGCDDWDTKKTAACRAVSATRPAEKPQATVVQKEPARVEVADSTTEESSLFSSSSVMQLSFAELAQQGASTFGKSAGSPPKSSLPLLAGAGSRLFQSASRRKSDGDDGEEEVAPSSEVHFEPVVPLPDLVELRTGEEEEEALFCNRAKLYIFHANLKQWKERAIGDIKILKHAHRPCSFRVLMRRDQVHKIACNHAITGFMRLAPLSTSANSLTWNAIDYTDGKPSPESFAVRFKNAEILDTFAKTFEECRLAVLEKENRGAVSGRNGEHEKGEQESTEKEEDEEEEEEEDEEDEDEEDDDDHGEDVMFEKRVTLAAMRLFLQMVGMGNLRMVYDDSCYGARIRVLPDEDAVGGTGVPLCDTIVAVQTCLRTERLHAFWSAVDMSRSPHERRHFRATFSSPQAVQEFDRAFTEGKELALSSSIVETIDEPPSHPKPG
ncbi:unnamed protein product [Ixodes hexagonus]